VISDPRGFILANTRLQHPPHVPEVSLYLADEITPIWRMTEAELGEIGLPPPFWAFAWAGGQALARYLLDHPREAKAKKVIDFGAGSGLVAIAAMLTGATEALAADIDPICAAAVEINAIANGVPVRFMSKDLLDRPLPKADLICAGDVFYEKDLGRRAFDWLTRAHAGGAEVLIGDPGRAYFPREGLIKLAEYQVTTSRDLEDAEIKRTAVWRFPD
jgi:predicted nicotinamide N-methyase